MYHCPDCSYSGKAASKGVCPACGSSRFHKQKAKEEDDKPKWWQLPLLVMLWLWFAFEVYRALS